jgi:ATP-dependent protease ClpP protease subunit
MKNHLYKIFAVILILMHGYVQAMDFSVHGDVLKMSGAVINGDLTSLKINLETNPSIKTIVLHNSYGGHVSTGYDAGELIRKLGLRTVVSGYCISSCSRIFLGGAVRQFSNEAPLQKSYIGFHGHYDNMGALNAELVEKRGLYDWIVKYTDDKVDKKLLAQWIAFKRNTDIVAFFHPSTSFSDGFTVRNCERYTNSNGAPLRCPGLPSDALQQGVITTLEQFALPASLQ